MSVLEALLPPHKCGLFLTHNEHKDCYETAEQFIEEQKQRQCQANFENEEMEKKSIETNEIWELQWYPDTPIGFYDIFAPTLEDLLRFAGEVAKEDKKRY